MVNADIPQKMPRRNRLCGAIALVMASLSALGAIAILAASYGRVADVMASAVPAYAVAGIVSAALFLIQRRYVAMAAVALITVPALYAVYPYLPFTGSSSSESHLTVLSANLDGAAQDFTWIAALAVDHDPDVIFLQEYTPAADAQLKGALDAYPHRLIHAKNNVLGMAMYSRLPLRNTAKQWLVPSTYATLFATISVRGVPIRLINFHAPPPVREDYYATRNAELAALPDALKHDLTCIAAGDFNAPPWSPFFRAMIKASRLHEARRNRGLYGTWPRSAGPFRIPIDHILYRGTVTPVAFRSLSNSGSDHLPMIAAFQVHTGFQSRQ
jgi:endonuclease/exonuclease/phosphatase (EEP) superfamily protein YafD